MGWKWKNPGSSYKSKYSGLYRSWKDMINRAGNRDGHSPTYSDVTVCERWLSYDNFFEDMSDTWWKGATIDKDSIKPGNRIYCKEYCKWVTRSENAKERNNRCGDPFSTKKIAPKKGKLNARSKKVKCFETGEIFDCAQIAARYINLKSSASLTRACRDGLRAGGYHWEYIKNTK